MLDQDDLDDLKACNSATFLKKYLSSILQESTTNFLQDTMKFLFTLVIVWKIVRTSSLIILFF